MAATISVADWELLTSRTSQLEAGLTQERTERGQFVASLQDEFGRTQTLWARLSSQMEELRAQLDALRASFPGGPAGPGGAALLDPRLMDRSKPFHGHVGQWKDWYDSFRSFIAVMDPGIYAALKEAES